MAIPTGGRISTSGSVKRHQKKRVASGKGHTRKPSIGARGEKIGRKGARLGIKRGNNVHKRSGKRTKR